MELCVSLRQVICSGEELPRELVNRLHADIYKAMHAPDIKAKLIAQGTDPVGSSAADFNTFWQAQLALWLPVVEASGVKLE